jgi:hypothetical protein
MVDREIRAELLGLLRITPQALSLRAQKLKSKYGPMSTDEAVYIIAHQSGIDISKYLSVEQVDRTRSLLPRDLPVVSLTKKAKEPRSKRKKAGSYLTSYPLVGAKEIAKSVLIGGETFPQVFILENSIRNLISEKLETAFGKTWWESARIKSIRDNVQKTIDKEKKFPHREKRGLHPIYYSNFADLKQIILNERNCFSDVIVDFQWFEVEMDQVYMARNSLAHSVPITDDDASRIRLFFRDWARLLEAGGFR